MKKETKKSMTKKQKKCSEQNKKMQKKIVNLKNIQNSIYRISGYIILLLFILNECQYIEHKFIYDFDIFFSLSFLCLQN